MQIITYLNPNAIADGAISASKIGDISKSITWSELKTMRDAGELTAGMQYRITDYQCTTTQEDTRSANHQFDIIVTADSESILNEEARAIKHEDDTYFAECDLNAWKIWYCLDNDTSKFAWADSTNGKGVIYRMIDEWNNDVPYDFKNMQFARWKLSNPVGYINDFDYDNWENNWIQESTPFNNLKTGFYGLNSTNNKFYYMYDSSEEIYKYKVEYTISGSPTYYYTFGKNTDYSINGSNYSNVIKEYKSGNKIQLNNIVFLNSGCYNNTFGINCYNNTFGGNSYSNSFGNKCYSNTFGEIADFDDAEEKEIIIGCTHNSFGNNCYDNSFIGKCNYNNFGNNCYDNNFGSYFYDYSVNVGCNYNTFGNECYENNFDNMCYNNTFGNECFHNIFDRNCYSNIFGNHCFDNTLGDYSDGNIFGNDCYGNNFGSVCHDNIFGNYFSSNIFGDHCYYNSFGSYCYYIKFASASSSTAKYNYYKNNHFGDGCHYILFKGAETASSDNQVQNYNFAQGTSGASDAYLTIDGKRNRAYETYISKDTDGTIKESVIADNTNNISTLTTNLSNEISARTQADTELQTQINSKQEALTLTVKDNGNIVLANIQGKSKEFMPATPSGDPMHYAYVAAGAEYNDTGADIVKTAPWADMADDDTDKTVVHKAGYWYLNGLGDITNEQMRQIYGLTLPLQNNWTNILGGQNVRTNFITLNENIDVTTNIITVEGNPFRFSSIEIIRVPTRLASLEYSLTLNIINTYNLKHILGVIKVSNSSKAYGMYALRTIKIYGLKNNSNFYISKMLSTKSVLYMINNEAATASITITLHADVYNKCMANADILAALEQHTNISLASA